MDISFTNIIDLNIHSDEVIDDYKNVVLSHLNDHVVRKSIMTKDFYWHYHPNSDETFIVLEGTLLLDLETGTLELNKGQMITIPKNMPHRTRPKDGRSVNLTIELADMETVKVEESK